MVERIVRAARRAPDRLLQGWRRSAAWSAASRRPAVSSILVVCHGNICRSPYAEAALQRALGDTPVRVRSAGFIAPGRKAPPQAIAAAAARGHDLAEHRSRVLDAASVGDADLIVTMDAAQARAVRTRFGKPAPQVVVLGDFDSAPGERRAILDPVDQPVETFARVYARIDRCAAGLSAAVRHAAARALQPERA